ncbi:MAG: hypothetical protein SPE59_06350 [Treponema sp.]|nr:hypothetical protein [Treponema sp.]
MWSGENMENKKISYAVITLERFEDKPETMGNVDRIEKVEGFDDDGNSIKIFDEFSYDGAEFHVDEDPRKYVADKLKLPMENVHFDDEI